MKISTSVTILKIYTFLKGSLRADNHFIKKQFLYKHYFFHFNYSKRLTNENQK